MDGKECGGGVVGMGKLSSLSLLARASPTPACQVDVNRRLARENFKRHETPLETAGGLASMNGDKFYCVLDCGRVREAGV